MRLKTTIARQAAQIATPNFSVFHKLSSHDELMLVLCQDVEASWLTEKAASVGSDQNAMGKTGPELCEKSERVSAPPCGANT